MNYREAWYRDNKLPYEPPKLEDMPPFRCLGVAANDIYGRITKGELGPGKRAREPGDDDEEIAA